VVTPNTLVRHCTQLAARPLADQGVLKDRLALEQSKPGIGDRLEQAWPRKTRDRLALAEGQAPCDRHKQLATLVCVRCHAPYCSKCQMKPRKKSFFLCRRCQASFYNRRVLALMLDTLVLYYLPLFVMGIALAVAGMPRERIALLANVIALSWFVILFLRDSLFRGAGPGKRTTGLRVVRSVDGASPLSNGQGVIRWLSQFIPFFNIYDLLVPYRDPLFRRVGDRWAGTRVLDSPGKLEKARAAVARRLFKKGFQPPRRLGTTMEDLARSV
jgi:uncharacterized RDD family membrane protein YckC